MPKGHTVLRKRLSRSQMVPFFTRLCPLPDWYEGLWQRALLGTHAGFDGAYGKADKQCNARICALSQ